MMTKNEVHGVPGKFFLAGEYLALRGGPTLTVAMQPYFRWSPLAASGQLFHPDSAPARLDSRSLPGQIHDPHEGSGGMGLSIAEFIFQYIDKKRAQSSFENDKSNVISLWREYRRLYEEETNPPSGVDLITQCLGGYVMTRLNRDMFIHQQTEWPFPELDWALLLTGQKLATHLELKRNLSHLNYKRAEQICESLIQAFLNRNSNEFVENLKTWSQWLSDENLVAEHSKDLIQKLEQQPGVLLAKGCGAMGSDSVFVLFEKNKRPRFPENLRTFSSDKIDTRGLHVSHT